MNLDLLKKLTRLANNNPNDNEANLAARRVCKMLAECDFKLTTGNPIADKMGIKPEYKGTWSGFKQPPSNPQPKPQPEPEKTTDDLFRDIFNQMRDFGVDWSRDPFYRPSQRQQEFYGGQRGGKTEQQYNPNRYDIPFDPFSSRVEREPRAKRPLECTRCHQTVETGYVGNLFVCHTCQWNEYKGI